MWFFETPPGFHWVFANVNARSPLAGIIRVLSHMGRDLPETHTQPACTYCALCSTTVEGSEKSHMRTTYQKKTVWDSIIFLPKTWKVIGFSGSVNGATKTQVFYIANVNGPYILISIVLFNWYGISLFFLLCHSYIYSTFFIIFTVFSKTCIRMH